MAYWEISLAPSGNLYLAPTGDATSGWPGTDASLAPLQEAFSAGAGEGLLALARLPESHALPAPAAYWRRFAREFLFALCLSPTLESERELTRVVFPAAKFENWPELAPLMRGGEYLATPMLADHWEALTQVFARHAAAAPGSMQALLAGWDPVFHVIGRVYFHLAENKNDPEHPFAFLATYTHGVSAGGKPQHTPLARALEEFAGAKNKPALARLLGPVSEAAKQSAFVKELAESGAIFRTLAWTPRDAHRFLRELPACEQAGLLTRVPDWWKPVRRPRIHVGVSVGRGEPAGLGSAALVDFSVDLALDGETLSAAEWKHISAQGDGLVFMKGRWVELDRDRLDEVLRHWRKAEKAAAQGIPLSEALRMLAGLDARVQGQPGGSDDAWALVEAKGWLEGVLEGLRDPAALRKTTPSPHLRATLRPYQELGFQWLWFLQQLGLGACLADDMGLGKTLQVLALLRTLHEGERSPSLLVVPASLLGNWESECNKFAPDLPVLFVHPSMEKFTPARVKTSALVVTSYGYLLREKGFAARDWDLVILDEAQAIKNPGTKQAQAVKALRGRARVALTGTPVENRLTDLWSLFDFLNPGLLGGLKAFERLAKAKADGGGVAAVRKLVRPYILRRMKTDKSIIADLPEKTEMVAYCGLSKTQAVLYQKAVNELAANLGSQDEEGFARRGIVLAYLLRLKQICNHPSQWLSDGAYRPGDSGKFGRLAELCEPIAARQEKALVFTQFQTIAEPLAAHLQTVFGSPGLVLHGAVPVKARKALVERFQTDERIGFFVVSVKAGGVGLNLTQASHVIHFDRWWNPAVENQATDRAYRIGQKNAVMVHKFVCRGTIEERIDAMLAAKQQLAADVLEDSAEAWLTGLGNAELIEALSLNSQAGDMALT